MGEYILVDDEDVYLGCCEDIRRVRREELERWIEAGRTEKQCASLPPAAYLKPFGRTPRHQWLYRFPYPWEDRRTDSEILEGDRFKPVGWLALPSSVEIRHDSECRYVQEDREVMLAKIVGQRGHDETAYTLFECAGCRAWFSLTESEVLAMRHEFEDSWLRPVVARVRPRPSW